MKRRSLITIMIVILSALCINFTFIDRIFADWNDWRYVGKVDLNAVSQNFNAVRIVFADNNSVIVPKYVGSKPTDLYKINIDTGNWEWKVTGIPNGISELAVSANGGYVAYGRFNGGITVRRTRDLSLYGTAQHGIKQITALSFRPEINSRLLASGEYYEEGPDVKFWDFNSSSLSHLN